MTFTKEDLERATEFARNKAYGLKALAKLIADVRREQREKDAKIAEDFPVSEGRIEDGPTEAEYARDMIARQIRSGT